MMRPASGRWTPARIFISVDLPAPFSPTSACASPGRTARSTPESTAFPAKDFEMSSISSAGAVDVIPSPSASPRLLEQRLHLGRVEVLLRQERDAGVDPALGLPAVELHDEGADALVAHLVRVLQHERVDRAGPEVLDQVGARVEADEHDLSGEPLLLDRLHGADG